jgi:S-adenosylmethionine:tRNA ribosyltransferase-isomerase
MTHLATTPPLSTEKLAGPILLHDGLFDFALPAHLEAGEPPEARGLARDGVRLLVSSLADDRVVHAAFRDLPDYLAAGDVLVINTSGTMNAALDAVRADGTPLELHLSTHLPADLWVVELRARDSSSTKAMYAATAGETVALLGGASATLHAPYLLDRSRPTPGHATRLWVATLHLPCPLAAYLAAYGFPIRYSYVKQRWPSSYYQTVYATETGSAEMPSAGRAFTPQLLTRLIARGVAVTPLLLHTGVASLEEHEPPYEEFYRVGPETARTVNAARAAGHRVVAVGTTVVRALETVTDADGVTHPGTGWTRLVITPQRGIRAVTALLTGLHEPRASHLAMLAALAGVEHLRITYAEALREGYLWHEFGDLHLILPNIGGEWRVASED